jgi:GTP cyclohydrolase I
MAKSEKEIVKNLSEFLDFLGIKKNPNTLETPKRMINA